MNDAVSLDQAPKRRWRPRPDWPRRLLNELLVLLLALAFLLSVGLVLLDTAPGHRFIVDRIERIETASGLRFKIGRIEGSIFGESRLKAVAVADSQGVFLTSPEIELHWSPAAWLFNKLSIDRIAAERLTLSRLPELKPTARDGPILPDFDIHIGELEIARLELGPAVTGVARAGRVSGSADIEDGRVKADLNLFLDRGGDRIIAALDVEPDGDRFNIDIQAKSPANGLLPAIVGSKRSMDLVIDGVGTWRSWRGLAALDLSGRPTVRLNLTANDGRFGLSGRLAPAQFLKGKLMRLTAPVIRVRGEATLENRILDGELTLGSPSLRAVAAGQLDLAENRYRRVRVGVDLLRPPALFPNMTGRDVRMLWTLDGPF
ncbi:MAG TPA: translocation/assembly module TamB, partial [Sphingomicrobium sp.]